MRHAERLNFPKGHHGNDEPLTSQGKKDAIAMGGLLKTRHIRLFHSPVHRCWQTADGVGSVNHFRPSPKELISLRCDVYVDNFGNAKPTLDRLVSEPGFYNKFVRRLSEQKHTPPYPNFRAPFPATAELVAELLPRKKGWIGVGITHDWLVNVAASHATSYITKPGNYAGFLDALLVWKSTESISYYYYKGRTGKCRMEFAKCVMQALKSNDSSVAC